MALGIGLTLAGAGCAPEAAPVSPAEEQPAPSTGATGGKDTKPGTSVPQDTKGPESNGVASSIAASAFEDRVRAETIINVNQGKPSELQPAEQMVGNVIVDPAHADTVYFATAGVAADGKSAFVGVYSYDTVTRQWSRLYKETAKAEANGDLALLKAVAHDGAKLYLVREPGSGSPTVAKGDEALSYDFAEGKARLEATVLP